MKSFVAITLSLLVSISAVFGAVRYVAPTGSDSNTGTIGSPYKTLSKGVSSSVAGDTIYVRGGTYLVASNISISKTGSAGVYLKIWAYPGEQPVFDFATETSSDGISLKGTYTYLRGMEIIHAFHNGINVSGHYNIIENCKVHDNRNSGVQMGSSSSNANPSNNLFLNIDSYLNYDAPIGGNADGFAIKWNIGTGNVIRGCRAYNNSDDGWDMWMATNTVVVESCMAFRNAVDTWHQSGFNGNGNGFKLGGNNVATPHVWRNLVSFDNAGNSGRGYDENNNLAGQTLYNCTAFRNKGDNFHMTNVVTSGQHVVKNCLSYLGNNNISSGTVTSNSWQGFTVSAGDFVSLDTTQAVLPRNADGSLQTTTFMHLVHSSSLVNAGVDVGIPYLGSAPDLGAYETSEIVQYALTTSAVHGSIVKSPGAIQYDSATNVQVTAVPDAGYGFTGWSGDLSGTTNPTTVLMSGPKSITASFALITYTISSSAGPNGSITPSGISVRPQGDSLRFTISANTGYHIDSVLVDGVDQGQIETFLFSNLQASHTIAARFAQNPPNSYILTVSGTNGVVTPSPVAQYYLAGQNVQLTATPDYGYHFVSWSGDASGNTNPLTLLMDANKSVTAVFAIDSFAVNTIVEGAGIVTRTPDIAAYPYNSTVQLTAIPAIGQHFVAWSGDAVGTDDTLYVTVDTAKTITATFATNTYPVVVNVAGSGSVTRNPNQSTVYFGNSIQLTAVPQTGWLFSGWSGDTVTSENPISFTVHDTIRTTALFVVQTFAIDASAAPHGAISPTGSVPVNYNSTQRFVFTPASGYIVDSLFVDDVLTPDSLVGYTFRNVLAAHTIRVTFTATNAIVDIITGWNLVSLPVDVPDKRVTHIFPAAQSLAYAYEGSYVSADSMHVGAGYWVKFPAPESHAFNGPEVTTLQVHVRKGWNIVGSLTGAFNVSSITSTPPGLITSPWYAYDGGYYQSDLIHAGMAYWVKASDSGSVTLSTAGTSAKAGHITIVADGEMPPAPPGNSLASLPVPTEFSLSQNYPNPFNPATTIRFGLPENATVTLKICSILGQEIDRVVSGEMAVGYHEVVWNATNMNGHHVASGIYYYVLETTGLTTGSRFVKTGRMILAQ